MSNNNSGSIPEGEGYEPVKDLVIAVRPPNEERETAVQTFDLERFNQGWVEPHRRMLCAGFRSGWEAKEASLKSHKPIPEGEEDELEAQKKISFNLYKNNAELIEEKELWRRAHLRQEEETKKAYSEILRLKSQPSIQWVKATQDNLPKNDDSVVIKWTNPGWHTETRFAGRSFIKYLIELPKMPDVYFLDEQALPSSSTKND